MSIKSRDRMEKVLLLVFKEKNVNMHENYETNHVEERGLVK